MKRIGPQCGVGPTSELFIGDDDQVHVDFTGPVDVFDTDGERSD